MTILPQPDIVERLRDMSNPKRVGSHFHPLYGEAADRIEELTKALEQIKAATLEGRVCDDVAWFDTITTLHDFCDIAINGPAVSLWNSAVANEPQNLCFRDHDWHRHGDRQFRFRLRVGRHQVAPG